LNYKLIIFDVDGTLVEQHSSWITVHEHFGVENLASKHLKEYEDGAIDYTTFMKKDISLWNHPLHQEKIEEILGNFTIMPNADSVIKSLKDKNYKVVLVSAGIDLLLKKLNKIFDIDDFIANGLEIDNAGILTGNGIFRVDLLNKHKALPKLLNSLNCTPEETIAVGDSKFDKTMLHYVGCGISIGNTQELKDVSDYQIKNLSELLDFA